MLEITLSMTEPSTERYTNEGLIKISKNIIDVLTSDFVEGKTTAEFRTRVVNPLLKKIEIENLDYYELIRTALDLYRDTHDRAYLGNVSGLILGYEAFRRQAESNVLEDTLALPFVEE